MPKTSPESSCSNAARTSEKPNTESITGRMPRSTHSRSSAASSSRRAHGRAEDLQLQDEHPAQVDCGQMAGRSHRRRRSGRPARALQRVVERGRADRLDDDVDPLGQARAGLDRGRAERGDPLALAGVAAGRVDPLAERDARARPPPSRHRRRRPARAPTRPRRSRPRARSIRYAVSHAVGRQAASAKRQLRRLRDEVAPGHRDPLGERARALLGEQRRFGSIVASPAAGHRSPRRSRPRCRPGRRRPRRSRGSSAAARRGRPTPRSDHRSWWLSALASTSTVTQSSGVSGSGRSPTVRPASGSFGLIAEA